MIKVKIGPHDINFPSAWEDLTFKQYTDLLSDKNDYFELLGVLTGLEPDYLRKATIVGLEELLTVAAFVNHPPAFKASYPKIGPFKAPNVEIRFESLAQFVDMKAIFTKMPEMMTDIERLKWSMSKYPTYIAIYLQKIRDGEYDNLKVPELEKEVWTYPAAEVLQLGHFFYLKLRSLLLGTKKGSLSTTPTQKKSKPVTKSSKKRLGTTRR